MQNNYKQIIFNIGERKQLTILAAIFLLFSVIGLLDVITGQFVQEPDIGYVYILLVSLAGTPGAFIASLSRLWIVWFLIGLHFASKANKLKKMEEPVSNNQDGFVFLSVIIGVAMLVLLTIGAINYG